MLKKSIRFLAGVAMILIMVGASMDLSGCKPEGPMITMTNASNNSPITVVNLAHVAKGGQEDGPGQHISVIQYEGKKYLVVSTYYGLAIIEHKSP